MSHPQRCWARSAASSFPGPACLGPTRPSLPAGAPSGLGEDVTLRARSAPRASPRPPGTPAPAGAVPPSASHRRCHSARPHPPGTRALRASITRLEQETKVGIRKPGLSRAGHVARVPRPRVPRGPPATQGTSVTGDSALSQLPPSPRARQRHPHRWGPRPQAPGRVRQEPRQTSLGPGARTAHRCIQSPLTQERNSQPPPPAEPHLA